MPAALLGFDDARGASRSHEQGRIAGELDLEIAFKPARMISEIPQAIFSAALRIAATSRGTFVCVDFLTDLARMRQHQDLARLVAARMTDKRVFPRGGGRSPKDYIANLIRRIAQGFSRLCSAMLCAPSA
jgi:hypothetical protein